ncbi:FecCD family ABC transporter permease [Neomoorella glycerini]|nr:iron ABC transporter permease [Moorella glycerini]
MILVSVCVGTAFLTIGEVGQVIANKLILSSPASFNSLADTVVMQLRLPRILLAIVTGISLAGAGAVMQGILRNPLVDPYTLGLSGGAAFGAALAIVLGTSILGPAFSVAGKYVIAANAFIFGTITMILVYGIAQIKGIAPETLVLGGVALGYLFAAGVSALKYLAAPEVLKDLVVWLMGGMWGASWDQVRLLFPLVLLCLAVLLRYSWDINTLVAGEEIAVSLGVKVNRLRLICLTASTLAASATVAFTGIIGFIGLVAPHICRMLIGNDHRFLIPSSCLLGAVLLLVADTLARTIMAPIEIPVGIITSLIGAPFFMYLLVKRKRGWWTSSSR